MIQMCHLNWNITWTVALEVININMPITVFTMIYENTFFCALLICGIAYKCLTEFTEAARVNDNAGNSKHRL